MRAFLMSVLLIVVISGAAAVVLRGVPMSSSDVYRTPDVRL